MKLDASYLRYMSRDEFRVLTAVEMGMRNHDVVPIELIVSIAGLKHGGAHKIVTTLLRYKLISHDRKQYDGYRLGYPGYDYLALNTLRARGHISAVGMQIGVGKESDIFLVSNDSKAQFVLKIHRLGRISFRNIKAKRDYLQNRKSCSWLYMSRLAALKEFAFMKALHDNGFPTPTPLDCNRHCVLMSLVKGIQLQHVAYLRNPRAVYDQMIDIVVRLAKCGLIHCDFNEFNAMLDEDEKITMIDFPQMISTSHPNAHFYFDRDVQCIRAFFGKRFSLETPTFPRFGDIVKESSLDVQIGASGFTPEMAAEFEELREAQEAEPETAGATEPATDPITAPVPAAGADTAPDSTEPISIKREVEDGGVDHSVHGSDSEYEDDVFMDESKLAEFLRKGPIHLEDREGMIHSGDEDSGASEHDEPDSEHDELEVQSDEEIVEVRRTWQDDADDEAAKFGRVPDGVRLACTGRGSRRHKGSSKGSRTIRDTVKASLIDKQKRELRTKPGNDQKGRERRKLKEALKEL